MKCKNCNFTIRTNELEFIDDLECECKHPAPVQDCKHLRDKRMNEHINIDKEDDGTYIAYLPHECSIEGIKFCPFCGDELK